MWLTLERRSRSARSLGGEPWNVQPPWKAAPPAGTSIGTSSSSTPSGMDARPWAGRARGGGGGGGEPVGGRVEVAAELRVRPVVRAPDVVDRSGVGARVVER